MTPSFRLKLEVEVVSQLLVVRVHKFLRIQLKTKLLPHSFQLFLGLGKLQSRLFELLTDLLELSFGIVVHMTLHPRFIIGCLTQLVSLLLHLCCIHNKGLFSFLMQLRLKL
jgi:hypothetical protein